MSLIQHYLKGVTIKKAQVVSQISHLQNTSEDKAQNKIQEVIKVPLLKVNLSIDKINKYCKLKTKKMENVKGALNSVKNQRHRLQLFLLIHQ